MAATCLREEEGRLPKKAYQPTIKVYKEEVVDHEFHNVEDLFL